MKMMNFTMMMIGLEENLNDEEFNKEGRDMPCLNLIILIQ